MKNRLLALAAVFALGCYVSAAAAYFWVDRGLGKVRW